VRHRKVLVAGALVLALGGGAFGVWNSSWLKLETVQVTGNHHATTQQVQAAAALSPGIRLTEVSSDGVSARVGGLPWVAEVTVTHVLPSRIRIAVRERTPAVVVQAGSRRYLVDHSGAVLQEGGTGYPVIAALPLTVSFPGDRLALPAFTAAMTVLDALPAELKPRLAWVNAPSPDLLSVILTDKTAITYGTSDSLPEKNYDVTTLLATGKPYASIDVRSPVHPAATGR
jgi:cell division protein FtsQ